MIMAMYVLIVGLWINMCLPIVGNGEADIMKKFVPFCKLYGRAFCGNYFRNSKYAAA